MSVVVLRCPHCGTTQSAPGECHACSEADVRYFCRNHDPGQWLDGPTCLACGTRFGERPPPRSPQPPPAAPQTRRSTPRPDVPSLPPSRRTDRVRRSRRRDPEPARDRERAADRERPPERATPPSLAEVLERMLGSRRRRRDDSEPSEGPRATPPDLRLPDLRLPTLYLKQFLFRLLWMGLVFIAFVIITMLFFVAGVVQTFGARGAASVTFAG